MLEILRTSLCKQKCKNTTSSQRRGSRVVIARNLISEKTVETLFCLMPALKNCLISTYWLCFSTRDHNKNWWDTASATLTSNCVLTNIIILLYKHMKRVKCIFPKAECWAHILWYLPKVNVYKVSDLYFSRKYFHK